jgi:amino acid adenylation domain-containing protein
MALIGKRSQLPADLLVHRVFEDHARRAGDRVAVTAGQDRLSYEELNTRANAFAHHLMSLGTGPGSVIGVCLDRTPELMVSILGIMKSGAAYLPLDPTYPPERLALMLAQLDRLACCVVSEATAGLLAGATMTLLDIDSLRTELAQLPVDNPQVELTNSDLCYVVFTSGSTGTPKATAVRHSGWYNLLDWLRREYQLDSASSGLAVSSFGFDISQRGLMAPLFTGAACHLLPSRTFDPMLAYRLIGNLGVKTLHCAPSTLYVLIEQEAKRGTDHLMHLDYVFIGGEPLNLARVQDWAGQAGNGCTLLHQYGVAECTDVASSLLLTDYPSYQGGALSTGKPVYNTEIRLLDDELAELPDGEVGEICISGMSVSAGYLNTAAVDERRFTEINLGNGPELVYRTGDRGYATPSGELVVVGRVDAQVKIRGMRMDLGDVEHAVRSLGQVADAVVLAAPDELGELSLVAFVVPDREQVDAQQLRSELLALLPRNMVPQEFVMLEAFPLSVNGKVDRRVLSTRYVS